MEIIGGLAFTHCPQHTDKFSLRCPSLARFCFDNNFFVTETVQPPSQQPSRSAEQCYVSILAARSEMAGVDGEPQDYQLCIIIKKFPFVSSIKELVRGCSQIMSANNLGV